MFTEEGKMEFMAKTIKDAIKDFKGGGHILIEVVGKLNTKPEFYSVLPAAPDNEKMEEREIFVMYENPIKRFLQKSDVITVYDFSTGENLPALTVVRLHGEGLLTRESIYNVVTRLGWEIDYTKDGSLSKH